MLRGLADESLLDTVTGERQPQNDWIIAFAVQLGKVLCELDPEKAAERDSAVRAAGPPPDVGLPPLEGDLLRAGDPLAGHLSLQGRLAFDGQVALLDEHAGHGFTLITRDGDGLARLDDVQRSVLEALDVSTVRLDAAEDADGRTGAWLDQYGVDAVLVRPDLYVFGSASSADELPALIDDLRDRLAMPAAP